MSLAPAIASSVVFILGLFYVNLLAVYFKSDIFSAIIIFANDSKPFSFAITALVLRLGLNGR